MKKIYITPVVLSLLAAAGCKDDMPYNGPTAEQGDEVEFSFVAAPESRTMYQNNWDQADQQAIYWGDYMAPDKAEPVKIYCYQAARKIGTYNVTPKSTTDNVAETIVRVGDAGVQWGDPAVEHNFYAFYPAQNAGDSFVDANGQEIEAEIEYGQNPVRFEGRGADGTVKYNYLYEGLDNKTQDVANRITWYGMPNMESAIMVASTNVPVANYGDPVPLDFHVVADVLDFTINGPITPNTLGGNAAGDQREFIIIQSVTIKHKGDKPITGRFKINMQTKKCTPLGEQSSILLTTAGHRDPSSGNSAPLYPTLYVRSTTTPTPDNITVDQLRMRAFLIPGQVKNMDELEIIVSTDCGEYPLDLKTQEVLTPGQIHFVKSPYFKQRGKDFDFTNWMSQLDPNIYISELSIPGTWHSSVPAYQGGDAYANYTTQYNAGIRAFEVHARNRIAQNYGFELNSGSWSMVKDPDKEITYSTNTWAATTNRTATIPVVVTGDASFKADAPEYYLYNYTTGNNIVDGMKTIGALIKDGAFALVEIGMDGQSGATVYDTGEHNVEKIETTITYTQKKGIIDRWSELTETQIAEAISQALPNFKPSIGNSTDNSTIYYVNDNAPTSTTYSAGHAWALCVQNVLAQLADAGVIYTEPITRNTTLGDVSKKMIIKINTNGPENGVNTDGTNNVWPEKTPALFSRWMDGSASVPLTVNLKWGQAIWPGAGNVSDPGTLLSGDDDMRWCYSELDPVTDIAARKSAIDLVGDEITKNYSKGLHRTWYEIAIGGYEYSEDSKNPTLENCAAIAKELNPYLLDKMTAPTRRMIPFGLVYMNYALGDNSIYYGADLIRATINNNSAFRLNRRPTATPSADSKTNASYASETRPPLKP